MVENAKVLVLESFDDYDLCMPEGGKRGVDTFWRKNASYDESRKDKRHTLRAKNSQGRDPNLYKSRRKKAVMPRIETDDEASIQKPDPVVAALLNAAPRPLTLVLSPEDHIKADREQAKFHAARERGLRDLELRNFATLEEMKAIKVKVPIPPTLSLVPPFKEIKSRRRHGLKPSDVDYDDRELERAREIEQKIAVGVAKRPAVYKGVKGGMLLAGYVGDNW